MTDRIAIVETAGRGVIRYYDATAEFYEPKSHTLTIVSTVRDEDLCRFTADEWRRVTVLDQGGRILFSIQHGTDPIRAVWLPEANQIH